MSDYVRVLSDPSVTLETVGGKGLSLARMLAAGLPVPDGFHVTTAAYRAFVAANDLQPRILAALEGLDPADTAALEAASQRIGALFAAGKPVAELVGVVTVHYARLGSPPVAVRSSATAEDLPEASFAGQQETYLNIRGPAEVLAAIQRCWASLWTARAIAYRLNNGIDQASVALAVVVQTLVEAEAAGILFTANPVTGKRDEVVINAAWGLGEAIVSGAVTPDTITADKTTGKVLKRETAAKQVMTVRTAAGTHEAPVPPDRQRKPVLPNREVAKLVQLGARVEQFFGQPMDVEWTFADWQFKIVQARPITAMPPEWKRPNPAMMYSRGSLAEHTPSPVTPLFATLGLELANQATLELWESIVGPNARDIVPPEGAYQALNSYVYLGLRLSGKNFWNILRAFVGQLGPYFNGSVERWQTARAELLQVVDGWEARPLAELSPTELLAGVRAVFIAACRYFTAIQSTLPVAATSEELFTRLYEGTIQRKGEPGALAFLLGADTMVLRSEKSLFDIAAWARTEPELANYLFHHTTAQLTEHLASATPPADLPAALWSEWRARLERHLRTFGRTAYEFDFANPTPDELPGPAIDALRSYLAGRAENPYQRQQDAADKREQAATAVSQRLDPVRRRLFQRLLRWARDTGPMREDSIFDMGMGHPIVRRMLGELGRRFAAAGAIPEADDIYWLEADEVQALADALERNEAIRDHSAALPARKQHWQAALKVVPPLILPETSVWSRFFHGGDAETRDGKVVLKGVGTSGGRITAPARVLFGPEDFATLKPGDVLVAVTTTPAWTPLFAQASAVVTDIGGPLSHSSIVAREYGIPAVMAARSATRTIQSGQLITVDGTAGTVTLGA